MIDTRLPDRPVNASATDRNANGYAIVTGGGTAVAGDDGLAITEFGDAIAGERGVAIAGKDGHASVGVGGMAMAGAGGMLFLDTPIRGEKYQGFVERRVGRNGIKPNTFYRLKTTTNIKIEEVKEMTKPKVEKKHIAVVGDGGIVTAPDGCVACAGDGGTAVALGGGRAISGREGTSVAGDGGTAITCQGGKVCAGTGGVLMIRWTDSENKEQFACIVVGDKGTRPDTFYHLNDNHEFEEVSE